MIEFSDVRFVTRSGRYRGVPFKVVLILGGDHGVQIDRISVEGFPEIRYAQGTDFPNGDDAFEDAKRQVIELIDD